MRFCIPAKGGRRRRSSQKCQNEAATTTKCKQAEQHTNTLDIYVCSASVCVCVQKETRCGQRPWEQIQCNKKCCLLASLSECVCLCERMFTHVCVCVFVCESVAVSSSRARLSVPFVALLLNSASSSSLCVGKFRPWELHVKFRW